MDVTTLVFEPLGRQHNRAAFSCDEPALTDYLRKQARKDMERDLASCWVLCRPGDAEIIGYYTLTSTSVDVSSLPPDLAKTAGRYPIVGAALLGRMAVDSRYARQGMGSHLLLNALRRVLRTTMDGPRVKAVVVDALHGGVVGFYEKFGFERIVGIKGEEAHTGDSVRLVLSLKTVRAIFPGEGADPDSTSDAPASSPP